VDQVVDRRAVHVLEDHIGDVGPGVGAEHPLDVGVAQARRQAVLPGEVGTRGLIDPVGAGQLDDCWDVSV
jgi:hypothetical protein